MLTKINHFVKRIIEGNFIYMLLISDIEM